MCLDASAVRSATQEKSSECTLSSTREATGINIYVVARSRLSFNTRIVFYLVTSDYPGVVLIEGAPINKWNERAFEMTACGGVEEAEGRR